MSRYLDPKNDVAFKKLFGTEDHKSLLLSFFNWNNSEMDAYVRANIALTDEFDARRKEREEGREEGEKAGCFKIAHRMLKKGFSVDEVSLLTGLNKEEIQKFAADNTNYTTI